MIRRRIPVDRAIFYGVAARLWQFLAGGLSVLVIARFLTPEAQGFFYAFSSLLAIQTLFDLGLTGVLIYVASHEWAAAADATHPETNASRQRLGELLVRARMWYGLCAVAFAVVAILAGLFLFSRNSAQDVVWRMPWIAAVLISSVSLWFAPSLAILEGCNRVADVNRNRFLQAIAGNLFVWGVLIAGGSLWSVVASAVVRAFFEFWLIRFQLGPFLKSLVNTQPVGPPLLRWKEELLPLQWRVGLQGVAGYFAVGFFVPVIFDYHGAVLSGQMGMTWNAINTIQMAAYAWVSTRIPTLGQMLFRGEAVTARRMFQQMLLISTIVYCLGIVALIGVVLLLSRYVPQIAGRFLPPVQIGLLSIGVGLNLLVTGLGSFVRAHKVEPFLLIGVATSLALSVLAWYLGARFGPTGLALAHMIVMSCLGVPLHYYYYHHVQPTTNVQSNADEKTTTTHPKKD